MEEQLLGVAVEQGIWALLFVFLLLYILKKQEARDKIQEEREHNYQDLLSELSKKFDIVSNIREDVSEIKDRLKKI